MTSPSIGGTNGRIPWRVATQQFVRFGSVSPSSFLAGRGRQPDRDRHGQDAVIARRRGRLARVSSSASGGTSSIPVALRSVVEVSRGGAFHGTLTGGNGRPPGEGQEEYYVFHVGRGVHDITANVSLANDAANPVGAYLISPDGDTLGFGQNSTNGHQTLAADRLHP